MKRSANRLSRAFVIAASAAVAVSAAALPARAAGAVVPPVPPAPVHGKAPTTEQALVGHVSETLTGLGDKLSEGRVAEVLKAEEAPSGKTN
ncbi:hypothetical protein BJF79_18175 [Actinomadura sp. CNU-125]|uniref:hypothetical protein n=1 Tax=Actinomadura sp. CNU-125 TaxID=1904961 RepID=UPI0009667682|nr:hypothetical protein [Actinomadura sp. CNU-125]OLT17028.1 hypothetical protein BJF79_18175 [Actinomadura sp. CNU-125]